MENSHSVVLLLLPLRARLGPDLVWQLFIGWAAVFSSAVHRMFCSMCFNGNICKTKPLDTWHVLLEPREVTAAQSFLLHQLVLKDYYTSCLYALKRILYILAIILKESFSILEISLLAFCVALFWRICTSSHKRHTE